MPLLHLSSLPRGIGKSELLGLLDAVGGLDRRKVGRIELDGDRANIEVPEGWEARLVKKLDGHLLGQRRLRARSSGSAAAGRSEEDHFQRLARLLDLESKAEAQQAAARARRLSPAEAELSGNSLIDLVVSDEDTGLGGRYLVELMKRKRGRLPWTRLDVGSPVVLSPHEAKTGSPAKKRGQTPGTHGSTQVSGARAQSPFYRGVVCERGEQSLRVALGTMPDDLAEHETWRVDLSFDEVAIERQRAALEQARLARGDRTAVLRDVLIGQRQPEFGVDPEVRPLDKGLNAVQVEAVQFALSARDVGLIHGPPGTGKTTAVVEVIRQAVRRRRKVLACAPSNLAVDNIFERLLGFGERAVRLGHPARVLPALREHTLDLLVERHQDVKLARKLVKQALGLFREAGRYTRAAPKPGAKRQLREDAKSLLADARRLEMQAVESILDSARVLCVTTTAIDSQVLGTRRFDLAVIDEACQSVEPGCWIPLLRCDRVVLAGDHCQLPPTVVSREAADAGFGVSLFERLMKLPISRRLTVQYRMNQTIADFSSRELYDGQLEADASVREHVLADLPGVAAVPLVQSPAEFLDTAGAGFDEELEPDGESRLNRREAAMVCRKVRALLDAGVAADQIAVIAPYAAQVRHLREQLATLGDCPNFRPSENGTVPFRGKGDSPVLADAETGTVPLGVEIDSVDGFQGREKEAVVISLVRSNATGEIGFLADVRRMNVALTRARRKLLVIGDSATLGGHPFYKRMIEYFEAAGAYRTVWEEGDLP